VEYILDVDSIGEVDGGVDGITGADTGVAAAAAVGGAGTENT
jgi:hypothetical protein